MAGYVLISLLCHLCNKLHVTVIFLSTGEYLKSDEIVGVLTGSPENSIWVSVLGVLEPQ